MVSPDQNSLPFVLQLPDLAPGNELDLILLENFPEFIAGEEIEIALSPRRAPIRMIMSSCPHFCIVIRQVDDNLTDARLHEIGRASCRERVWVWVGVDAVKKRE